MLALSREPDPAHWSGGGSSVAVIELEDERTGPFLDGFGAGFEGAAG